jgi:hypothetical protein
VIDSTGRGGGIRTPDPLLPKQMRYQTALRPDACRSHRSLGKAERGISFRLYPDLVSMSARTRTSCRNVRSKSDG